MPVALPVLPPACVPEVLRSVDGVVLSGGGDVDPGRYGAATSPETGGVDAGRDELELELARQALRRRVPLLAICRGAQVLNVARGGTLHQHLPDLSDHPHRDDERSYEAAHHVEVDPTSRLARTLGTDHLEPGEFRSNTLHHQAVDRLGRGLRAVAWAEDRTIEAIEPLDDLPVLAVQWHPELLTHLQPHQRLFDWVVAAAAASRRPEHAERD